MNAYFVMINHQSALHEEAIVICYWIFNRGGQPNGTAND
jgi:hypothetical protein